MPPREGGGNAWRRAPPTTTRAAARPRASSRDPTTEINATAHPQSTSVDQGSVGDGAQTAGLAAGEAVEADRCGRVGGQVDNEPLVVEIGEFEGFEG